MHHFIFLVPHPIQVAGNNDYVLPPWLALDGYVVRVPSQRELKGIAERNQRVLRTDAAVGNALLLKADRLQVDAQVDGQLKTQASRRVGAVVRGAYLQVARRRVRMLRSQSTPPFTHRSPFLVRLEAPKSKSTTF